MKVILDDTRFAKLDKELLFLKKHILVIGVLGDAKSEKGVKVIDYAIWNEYGTLTIPARPFFRNIVGTRRGKRLIEERMKKQVELILAGETTAYKALENVGIYVVGLIKESLLKGNWRKNADSTIKIKGKNNPLRDQGTLLKSIDFEIKRR